MKYFNSLIFIILSLCLFACGGKRHIDRPQEPEIIGDFSDGPDLVGKQLRPSSISKIEDQLLIRYATSEIYRSGGYRIIENLVQLNLKSQKAINPLTGEEIGELVCVKGSTNSDSDLNECSHMVVELKNTEFLFKDCQAQFNCPKAPEFIQMVIMKMKAFDFQIAFEDGEMQKFASVQNYGISIQKNQKTAVKWFFIQRLEEKTASDFTLVRPIDREASSMIPILGKTHLGKSVATFLKLPRQLGDGKNIYYSDFSLANQESKKISVNFKFIKMNSKESGVGILEVNDISTEQETENSLLKRKKSNGRNPSSEKKTTLFGHNMSPTTYTLSKGQASIGTYAAIVGVTDELVLGFSPWMYFDYNMYTGVARYARPLNENVRIGGQLIYFKTDRESLDIKEGYQMEAYSGNLTLSYLLPSQSVLHFNYNHMYFKDETVPFSLRREPFNDDPFQSSLTMLVETKLTDRWGVLGEIGALGLNYSYPQVILGSSMHYEFDSFLIQLGFNITSTPISLFSSDRDDANNSNNGQLTTERDQGKYDFSVHPEIQIQYTF